MEKLLTIIVPVYKVEAYINKCLDSLLVTPELMQRLEVLLINDGTPDNSAEMSREYVKRFPETFRQIDKENGGHGSAWNVGLKEARGKYLRFLDSDDWFTNLDCLMEDLETTDADIVFNPFIKEFSYEGRTECVDVPKSQGTSRITSAMWGVSRWGYHNVNFWAATYRTDILKPLQPLFAERTMFDDYIITWAPLVNGRLFCTFNYPVYHYLIGRPGQSMSATQQRKGAVSYVKSFTHFEQVRSRIDESRVPSELLNCIDVAIIEYANYIFSYMVYLPYRSAKKMIDYLWKNYLVNRPNKSKLLKRYALMPSMAFYCVEHLRRKINRV